MAAILIVSLEWMDTIDEANTELVYANKIMTSSVQSVFHKNEALLKILGERLVDLDAINTPNAPSLKLMNNLLDMNKELAGINLARPSGDIFLTSLNVDITKLPNLLSTDATAKAFKIALESDRMIIGHTYFMEVLNQWIIPLRLRILNSEGDVSAVLTTGLKLNASENSWASIHLPEHIQIEIFRKDYYRQYIPKGAIHSLEEAYSEPLPQDIVDDFEQALIDKAGLTLAMLRESNETISSLVVPDDYGAPVLSSISYDQVYENYTVMLTSVEALYEKMYSTVSRLLLILIIFNLVLYFIFRANVRLQSTLKFQASHDPLTGLPNRRYLLDNFSQWQGRHNDFYVIFIDLDNFKSSNDLHGHTIGDEILKEVSSRISQFFSGGLTIRHGGDEFIILYPYDGSKNVLSLCGEFIDQLKAPILIGELDFSMRASIGISDTQKDGSNVDELLRKSDMAMYEAKRNGQAVSMFTAQLEAQEKRKAVIEKELHQSLERNELYLVYQPQVDAITKSVIGVETLIRWQNKRLGFVSPEEFIPIAESTGLIIDIGSFVLNSSIRDLTEVCKLNLVDRKLRLSVNISIRQLFHRNFIAEMEALSKQAQSTCVTIVAEVTESLFIEDMSKAKDILEAINNVGVDISLDDFGTGYSSLGVLNNLPINELKIDKSFVSDILTNEGDRKLIQSIINLSKNLGIPVIAEGVEEIEQADLLLEYGCDLFQGYYFSKPLTKSDLIAYLSL